MSRLITILQKSQTTGDITTTASGAGVSLDGVQFLGAQAVVTVDTPTAKTFLSGVAASLIVQDITYAAVLRGTAGNSITITYTGGATAGAEVVTVVGSAITVQIQDGVSTATQVHTAYNLVAAATALATNTITGTGSNAQSIASATPLAGGIASAVNTTSDQVTITSHGYTLGLKVRLTSTGTLPAGVTTGVDYFIIVIDANTVQFASSLANAQAGTQIDLTDQGSSGATNTSTATSLAGGAVKFQKSMDNTNWNDEGSSVSITGTGSYWVPFTDVSAQYARLQYTLTAGTLTSTATFSGKGPN